MQAIKPGISITYEEKQGKSRVFSGINVFPAITPLTNHPILPHDYFAIDENLGMCCKVLIRLTNLNFELLHHVNMANVKHSIYIHPLCSTFGNNRSQYYV